MSGRVSSNIITVTKLEVNTCMLIRLGEALRSVVEWGWFAEPRQGDARGYWQLGKLAFSETLVLPTVVVIMRRKRYGR
jgi:hypothetical protein